MPKYLIDQLFVVKNLKKVSPQKIGSELQRISDQEGGRLTPVAVVEAARDPDHVLHPLFEWDNLVAAENFRLDQARALIRSVHVVDDRYSRPPPVFISMVTDDGRRYVTVKEVQLDVNAQIQILKSAERDLEAWKLRYKLLAELFPAVEEVRGRVAKKRQSLESRA